MNQLLQYIKKSGGYFVSTIINQALPFIILPIITRYLSVEEYGYLSLFTFYMVVFNALLGSTVVHYISKQFFSETKEKLASIIGSSILIVFALTIIFVLIITVTLPFTIEYIDLPSNWIYAVILLSCSANIFQVGLTVMRNRSKVLHFSFLQVGNTFLNVGISVLLVVVFLWSWKGRAAGIIVANFISLIGVLFYLKQQAYLKFNLNITILRDILKVILPLIPNSLQMIVIIQSGVYLMNMFYTKELVGLYTIALQLALILRIFADTLNLTWSPFLYKQLSHPEAFQLLKIKKLFFVLTGIMLGAFVIMNLGAGLVFRVMTTEEYYSATEFIPWLSLGYFFYGLIMFVWPVLIKYHKQKMISMITLISMIIMLVVIYPLKQYFGYIGLPIAFSIGFFVMFTLMLINADRLLKKGLPAVSD